MQIDKKKFVISAFQEGDVSDALADLASITECLCDAEDGIQHRYGLFLFHKLIVDNLEMLSRRLRPSQPDPLEDELIPDEDRMTED